jgi:hypothetical protein
MDIGRFDQLAKACGVAGSRRWAIAGLFGSVLALSRIGAARATHRPGHHCTPSDEHAGDPEQTCREVNGEWTCQNTCLGEHETCIDSSDCCGLCCNADHICDATSCVLD